jgi:hypothetical protein
MLASLYFAGALFVGWLGRHRSLGFIGFFITALLLTPGVVFLVLLVTWPRSTRHALPRE